MSGITEKVRAEINSYDLDVVGEVRSQIAIQLSQKLDALSESETATAGMAMPQLTKELRGILQELRDSQADREETLADIFK